MPHYGLLAAFIALLSVAQPAMAKIAPKVFIADMYDDEASAWYNIPEFNVLSQNISIPGLSHVYPTIHCTQDGSICQVVCDEGEINAAVSTTSLWLSDQFDLTKTYWLIAGDAGINPKLGTLGSVAFARFAVQVALQYEFDPREVPQFAAGYVPQGATSPNEFPQFLYGTEVFELNDALRQKAVSAAKKATLNDTPSAQAYRNKYASVTEYRAANIAGPQIVQCDTATSDNWFSGKILSTAFENTTKLFTSGEGEYCTTEQEDNAVMGSLLRGALAKKVDFTRIISMRTGSDFDREAPGMSAADNLFNGQDAGYDSAVKNIYLAGVRVVEDIVGNWDSTYKAGVKPSNYVGDIKGTLGGTPPFVPASALSSRKRDVRKRRAGGR
ncbi:unnamed protein product [Peniophora sp. CBMAI 1063]|nr:unnamed protein product [Peniophora sp. CBMAI 1063]